MLLRVRGVTCTCGYYVYVVSLARVVITCTWCYMHVCLLRARGVTCTCGYYVHVVSHARVVITICGVTCTCGVVVWHCMYVRLYVKQPLLVFLKRKECVLASRVAHWGWVFDLGYRIHV